MRKYLQVIFAFLGCIFFAQAKETIQIGDNSLLSKANTETSPSIRGALLGDKERGIYSISTEKGSQLIQEKTIDNFSVWAGTMVEHKYHAFSYRFLPYGRIYLYTIYDEETWETIQEEAIVDKPEHQVYTMTYDISTGTTYSVSLTIDPSSGLESWSSLSTYNLLSGATKPIGQLGKEFIAIAAHPSTGQLYGFDVNGDFYSINKATAQTTLIGATGLKPMPYNSAAVFDKNTGKLYWPVLLEDNSAGLYEVEPASGKASLLSEFDEFDQMTGIYMQYAPLNSQAPASATELAFIPSSEGALNGKMRCKLPTETIEGSSLPGNLKVRLQVGSQPEMTEENLTAGGIYEKDIVINQSGFIALRVTVSNDAGEGETVSLRYWAGHDSPSAVSNLLLKKNNDGKPELAWAPPVAENGGFLDKDQLVYSILRLPDNSIVATNHPTTSFVDNTLPDNMQAYSYVVTPMAGGLTGESLTSNKEIFGNPFTPPYQEFFESEETFNLWTVIDADEDELTWTYDADNQCAVSPSFYYGNAKDWLLSPLIKLEAGAAYKLTYTLKSIGEYKSDKIAVVYGKSLIPEELNTIADYPDFLQNSGITLSNQLLIPSDKGGEYHFGFHAYSEEYSTAVAVENVKLELLAKAGTPNLVSTLSLTAGPEGSKSVSLSFQSPETDIAGQSLTGTLSAISIYRNEENNAIKVFSEVSFNELLQWTDNSPEEGINYYRIVASNTNGDGLEAMDSIYVGLDRPRAVTNLTLENKNGKAVLSWEAPSLGIHGGYINPATLKYQIIRSDDKVLSETVESTSYTDETVDQNDQHLYSYIIVSLNEAGTGERDTSIICRFGKAYAAPYSESFTNVSYTKPGWTIASMSESQITWKLINESQTPEASPQDGDNGMAAFVSSGADSGAKVCLSSPLIDVSTLDSPILKFWVFHYINPYYDSDSEVLIPAVSTNGETFVELPDSIYLNTDNGWKLHEIPLPQYKGSQEIQIGFIGYLKGWSNVDILIDNVSITNQSEKDLRLVSFHTPANVYAGQTNCFTAEVKNSGSKTVEEYTIEVYKGETLAFTREAGILEPGKVTHVECKLPFSLDETGKTYEFRSQIKLDGNENESGYDISEKIQRTIKASIFAPVPVLDVEEVNNKVVLTWTTPVDPKKPIDTFEDFESYDNFIIDNVGDWTMYDEDEQNTYVDSEVFYVPFLNREAPMAYQVFNAHSAGVDYYGSWSARSGQKCLASFTTATNVQNDDWLVSPLLPGVAQTIRFYAKGVKTIGVSRDRFIVYYSTSDKEIGSFIKLTDRNYEEAEEDTWEEYQYDLPLGSTYFAIRCVSLNNLTFLLDDISFVRGGENIPVSGYHVYRNGEKISSELILSSSYTDADPIDGTNTYTVSAVYGNSESAYSDAASINFEQSGTTYTQQSAIRIYSFENSITIKGAENQAILIITSEGVSVHSAIGTGDDVIKLKTGIYLVKTGDSIRKVIVK